jgi:hypothetical protein
MTFRLMLFVKDKKVIKISFFYLFDSIFNCVNINKFERQGK